MTRKFALPDTEHCDHLSVLISTLELPFRHSVYVYPNQWLPIQSRDHSVWQIQHHWKLHCGRVHTMCMQPPAHIKHVLLYGLNCHSAKQLTYHLLVTIKIRKISTKKEAKTASYFYVGHHVLMKTDKLRG